MKPKIQPTVGMGATQQVGSDRYPYTVVSLDNSRYVIVQADKATLIEGSTISEHQVYEYTRDPSGTTRILSFRKNGRWVTMGQNMNSELWNIGNRNAYRDPSF
jgi:hypothetical protein